MNRIAITGSSGYIGSRLVTALLARKDIEAVVGLDIRPPDNIPPTPFRHIQTDVRVPFAETLVKEGVDAAVHLAFTFAPARQRRIARAVNIDGTRHFLEACLAAGVKRAVVLSSATAYGARLDNPPRLTESSPLRARRAFQYSYEKRQCDEMCRRFVEENPRFSLAWCRPPVVFGTNVDNYVSRTLFKPKVIYVKGDDPLMQFIHEDDVCEAIIALLASDGIGPYNAAPDDAIRFTDLAAEFKRAPLALPEVLVRGLGALTYALRLSVVNETPPGALDYLRYPWLIDASKLQRETGFVCKHSSLETVRCWRQSVIERSVAGMSVPGKIRL